MVACKSWMKYSWEGIYCENPPLEGDPEGLCILHSLRLDKDKSAFDQAVQSKLAQHDYNFKDISFPSSVSFAKHKFIKPVDFRGAIFSGWADFREAEFGHETDCSHAKFAQGAVFEKVRFVQVARFKGIEIAGEADFRGATFDGLALFQHVNDPRHIFTAFFQYLNFGPDGCLRFQDVSLARAGFLGTDMQRLEFHNVKWRSHRGRQTVYDEILLKKKGEPYFASLTALFEHELDYEGICAKVGELYRYLKLDYEREGDLKQAGDFHYGEMEMHRRTSLWRRWFPFSWYNLYRVLSGYGERPLRALIWLVGLVVGVALSLQWLGLRTAEGSSAGLTASLIYVLDHMSLLRPEWPKPITTGGGLLTAVSHFFILGQAALFLLALRNRLGRRH